MNSALNKIRMLLVPSVIIISRFKDKQCCRGVWLIRDFHYDGAYQCTIDEYRNQPLLTVSLPKTNVKKTIIEKLVI